MPPRDSRSRSGGSRRSPGRRSVARGDCDAVLAFRLSTLHLIHPHRPRACITAARRDLTVCLRAFVSLPRTMSLTATKSVPPARPQGRTPDKIGKYAVIREVGRGSTGVVYLSHDAYYGRDVAIKVYNMDTGGDEERARVHVVDLD